MIKIIEFKQMQFKSNISRKRYESRALYGRKKHSGYKRKSVKINTKKIGIIKKTFEVITFMI